MSAVENPLPNTPGLDPDIQAFLDSGMDSYLKWDVLTFYYEGTDVGRMGVRELADSLGREEKILREEVEALARSGWLEKTAEPSGFCYRAAHDPGPVEKISTFLNYVKTREGRLKVIYHLTQRRLRHPGPAY